jgi:hypothetical protein
MVSPTIVSRYSGPPSSSDADRAIPKGPIYAKDEILELVQLDDPPIHLWSRKCISDAAKLQFEIADVAALISYAVRKGVFVRSEWCTNKPNGPLAACDAYKVERSEWSVHARKELPARYYVKFCIGKTGAILLVASCHLEESRSTK